MDGGTYFFTINLYNRKQTLLTDNIDLLRESIRYVKKRHPFEIDAMVVLPDHLHLMMTSPNNEHDFSTRIGLIKQYFTRHINKRSKTQQTIWQNRFWEHLIRDELDYEHHVNYIHYNPVKHGYIEKASDWPYSSIHQDIRKGIVNDDWAWHESDGKLRTGE